MSCTYYFPLISRLLDGELSPSEKEDVDGHVVGCETCRRALDDWRAQGTLLRGSSPGPRLTKALCGGSGGGAGAVRPRLRLRHPGRRGRAFSAGPPPSRLPSCSPSSWSSSSRQCERHSLGKVLNAGDRLEVRYLRRAGLECDRPGRADQGRRLDQEPGAQPCADPAARMRQADPAPGRPGAGRCELVRVQPASWPCCTGPYLPRPTPRVTCRCAPQRGPGAPGRQVSTCTSTSLPAEPPDVGRPV